MCWSVENKRLIFIVFHGVSLRYRSRKMPSSQFHLFDRKWHQRLGVAAYWPCCTSVQLVFFMLPESTKVFSISETKLLVFKPCMCVRQDSLNLVLGYAAFHMTALWWSVMYMCNFLALGWCPLGKPAGTALSRKHSLHLSASDRPSQQWSCMHCKKWPFSQSVYSHIRLIKVEQKSETG